MPSRATWALLASLAVAGLACHRGASVTRDRRAQRAGELRKLLGIGRVMHPGMLPRVAVIAVLCAAGCHKRATPPSGDVGGALTEATFDGAPFDPKTLAGRRAVVAFWKPGCEYCESALPKVLAGAHASGAVPVAIMVRGASSRAADELSVMGWDGPELVDSADLAARYAIAGVPYTLVLRGDGTAAAAFDGDVADADEIAAAVAAAR